MPPQDRFQEFNRFCATLQAYPLLRGEALTDHFREIDELLHRAVRVVLETTHFVEDNLCFKLNEIAVSSTKDKIYRGREVKKRQRLGQGVELGAENSKILGIGFDLFKLARTTREIAVPLVLRVLRSLRLQNVAYERMLQAFADAAKDYPQICEELTVAQCLLNDLTAESGDRPAVVTQMQRISELIDKRERIEATVGCVSTDYLYGAVALVQHYLAGIRKRQNEILQAYLRLIPGTVRQFAHGDQDAKDKFQAGALGLMNAISTYDYRMRAGFPRIARTWIHQRIQLHAKKTGGPLIRPADKIYEAQAQIRQAERELMQQGVEVTNEDIADYLDWPTDKVDQTRVYMELGQVSNLDSEILVDDEILELGATIPDDTLEDQEHTAEYHKLLMQIIEPLSPEDRRLVLLRFGCLSAIENNALDTGEILNEVLRQSACKTLLHQTVADRMGTVHSVRLEDEDDDEQ